MNYNVNEIFRLLEDAPFGNDMEFSDDSNWDFLHSNDEILKNYLYSYGSSRFVLIPLDPEKDYVIKIPYNNRKCSPCSYSNWDYCAAEMERYEEAKENNLEHFFAKIERIGYLRNYPIYVQEKCCEESYIEQKEYTIEAVKKTVKLSKGYSKISQNWLTDFRIKYGDKTLVKFIKFIKEKEWDDDLVEDNVGYKDDLPIVFDYASYYG